METNITSTRFNSILPKDSPIYIWGTRIAGLSIAKSLIHSGIKVEAFVDDFSETKSKLDIPIIKPETMFKTKKRTVIIATRSHSEKLQERCSENHTEDQTVIPWDKIQQLDYYIEITNRCNLNCLTCSSREYYNDQLHKMTLTDFDSCTSKIVRDDPFITWINLFGHNEPLIHPDIADLIDNANSKGLSVGISTNMSLVFNVEKLIRSKPMWIRVSTSGLGTNYEISHQGGKSNLVIENLTKISKLRSEYSPDTEIEVFFLKYNYNQEDIPKWKDLCQELGLELRYIEPSLIGSETIYRVVEDLPISSKTRRALNILTRDISETLDLAHKQRHLTCPNERMVRIHSDMSVAECQTWMGSRLPKSFLEYDIRELKEALSNTKYCKKCKHHSIHQYCEIVYDETNAK